MATQGVAENGALVRAKKGGQLPFPPNSFARRRATLTDIFWLRDEALEDSTNLPEPAVIAAEMVEDLRATLEQFVEIEADLSRQ